MYIKELKPIFRFGEMDLIYTFQWLEKTPIIRLLNFSKIGGMAWI